MMRAELRGVIVHVLFGNHFALAGPLRLCVVLRQRGDEHSLQLVHDVAQQLAARHVPLPPLMLVVALVLMVLGCVSLLFGYHTRHGAVLLFGLTIVAAVPLHDFWHFSDAGARARRNSRFSPATSPSAAACC